MESYQPPFESSPDPDETGLVEGSKKKKKKTTRIPKSTGILPKIEAEETSKKDSPEKPFEKMFARETDKKDSEDKDKSPEVDLTPEPAAEGEEVLPEQEFEVLEEEPVDLPDSLEGEFAEEGTIISRAEASQIEATSETSPASPVTIEAVPEPVESASERIDSSEPPIERFAVSETAPPVHRTMYESGARFEPTIMTGRNRAETTEPTITQSEHEREVHYARKRATSRGVLAGGVFGYWLGRRGRKAAETEAAEAHEVARKQSKKIERLETEQAIAAERFKNIQNTKAELINHAHAVEQQPDKQESTSTAEALVTTEKNAEQPKYKTEQAPEDQPINEATYQAPEGRRVETSSWHRYEVDEKTGKVVENPDLAYGQEFQKEQKQERLQRLAAEPIVAAQLGQTIIQNSPAVGTTQPYTGSTTEVKMGSNSKSRGISIDKTYVKQQLIKRTTSPLTWAVALGFVVLLFIVGIL